MKDISTIKKKSLKEETAEKQKNTKIKWRFYHSFFTIVLIGCVAQLTASAIINVTKTVSHRTKIGISKKLRDEAKTENDRLKKELKDFNMLNKIEAIARNKFKMTEEDEVVVIYKDEKPQTEEPQGLKEKFLSKYSDMIKKENVNIPVY